jgi:hypothetical protein
MALTQSRKRNAAHGNLRVDPVAADAIIYAGSAVCLDSSGNAVEPSVATGLKTRGLSTQYVDNTDGNAGDKTVETEQGCFGFKNSASTDAITQADVGNDCYWIDGGTVAKTSGSNTRSLAGKISFIEGGQVYVHIGTLTPVP